MMSDGYDILGLGSVAVDDLLYVPHYPPADAKVQVRRRERQCGGLTATALVAAARLGASCAYAGVLGEDEDSRFVLATFEREGIDTRLILRRPDARPIHSTIIVDESTQTRSIFYDLRGSCGADPSFPAVDVIAATKVLLVDHYGIEGMIRAVKIIRQAGGAVVADLERSDWPGFDELLALIDHLIVARDFARKLTSETDPAAAATKLWTNRRAVVVVTCGAEGCWVVDAPGKPPHHYPAFAVPAVDTTGCGDVFHGGYAAALARDEPLADRIRFAAAAAALKALHHGGQAGIPTRAAVEMFLRQ